MTLLPFRPIVLGIAVALLPAIASAQPAIQLRLSWDHCAADGKVADRSFACDTNTGSESLWLSMVIQDGVPRTNVAAISGNVDVRTTSSLLPPWWQTLAGQCRANVVSLVVGAPAAGGACEPWFGSGGVEPLGVFGQQQGIEGSNSLRWPLGAAVPAGSEVTLAPGTEYLLARIQITHARSVGTGACTGCLVPVCIGFGELDLNYAGGTSMERIAGGPASTVTWQGAYVSNYTPSLPGYDEWGYPRYTYSGNLQCATGPVPAGNRTWGTIKTLYR